jgi:hypothetical protein
MDRTTIKNLGLQPLDIQMRAEVKKHLWWSRFKGSVTEGRDANNDPVLKASGAPIEVNHKLKTIGYSDRLLIPMERDLAGAPTLGDATLIGREEPSSRAYAKVGYNQVRHAIPVKLGEMDDAREAAFRAAEENTQKLAWWHAQYENYNIITSIYEGASENLYTTKTNADYGQGLGIPRRFHPNLYYYAGSAAALTRVGDTSKFPTAAQIYTAATGATTPLSFCADLVFQARIKAMKLGLKPLVTENGFKFYPWLITPEQAYTLMSDATFVKALQAPAWQEHKSHPWVTGAIGYFGGFVFFEDVLSVRGFSGTSPGTDLNVLGSVSLVASEDLKQNPRFLPQEGQIAHGTATTKVNHVSIIFGESFLGESLHENLRFKYAREDYDNWEGLGAATKYGYERLDFVPSKHVQYLEGSESDVTTYITNVYNKSSMLVMTWQ